MCSHSCRVPSNAKGDYVLQVTFDTGPLAGEVMGQTFVTVKGE